MSETTPPQQAATLIARFDATRDDFLAAFAQAPDAALSYTPAGEEYALGILPLHLQDSINHYLNVYERMVAADFGPVNLNDDPALAAREAEQHRRLTVTKPTGADRDGLLAAMEATHRSLTDRFNGLDDTAIVRTADVIYAPGGDPYPTSAAAILGWLTDHYDEHVAQTAQLIARWQAEQAQ